MSRNHKPTTIAATIARFRDQAPPEIRENAAAMKYLMKFFEMGLLAGIALVREIEDLPESERDATAHDFVRNLPRKSYRVVEKLTGTVPRLTAAAFFSALPLCADRAGLLSCDDVTAAARMMARLQGEELALVDSLFGGAVLLGQVLGGTDLVRYFLSDAYHEVRGTLRDASPL